MKLATKLLDLLRHNHVENSDSTCYNESTEELKWKNQKTSKTENTSQTVNLAQRILVPASIEKKTKSCTESILQKTNSPECFQKSLSESSLIPLIYSNKNSLGKIILKFKKLKRDSIDSDPMIKLLKSNEFDSSYLSNIEKIPNKKKSLNLVSYWGRIKLPDASGGKSVRVLGVVEFYNENSILFFPMFLDTRENIDYNEFRTLPANTLLQENK